jgi:hypothetical protein
MIAFMLEGTEQRVCLRRVGAISLSISGQAARSVMGPLTR